MILSFLFLGFRFKILRVIFLAALRKESDRLIKKKKKEKKKERRVRENLHEKN